MTRTSCFSASALNCARFHGARCGWIGFGKRLVRTRMSKVVEPVSKAGCALYAVKAPRRLDTDVRMLVSSQTG